MMIVLNLGFLCLALLLLHTCCMHAFYGCRLWRAVIRLGGYELVCTHLPMCLTVYIFQALVQLLFVVLSFSRQWQVKLQCFPK